MAGSLGLPLTYGFYAASAAVSFFFVRAMVRETRGRSWRTWSAESADGEDRMADAAGRAVTAAHRQDAVQPCVARVGGLEDRGDGDE